VDTLDTAALPGVWQADAALRDTVAAAPDGYLCLAPAARADASESVAYRNDAGSLRVANTVRVFAPATAGELLAAATASGDCLAGQGGLTHVSVDSVDIADGGVLVTYRRPTAQQPVEVQVLYAQRGGLLSTTVQLGYPRVRSAVTRQLAAAAGEQLRAAP
jgi:hypothetical protein